MATNPNKPVFYVYRHLRDDSNEIFYVGKGMGRRAFDKSHRSKFWKNIVAKHGVRVELVKEGITESESIQLEIQTIDEYRRAGIKLINMTDGGDGTTGYSHTEEHRRKMSLVFVQIAHYIAPPDGYPKGEGLSLTEAFEKVAPLARGLFGEEKNPEKYSPEYLTKLWNDPSYVHMKTTWRLPFDPDSPLAYPPSEN